MKFCFKIFERSNIETLRSPNDLSLCSFRFSPRFDDLTFLENSVKNDVIYIIQLSGLNTYYTQKVSSIDNQSIE
ncbi:hypothetical protein BpHYR1_035400 [Brachionus plicatilis]|uniref:Uncharacterized protein n=1 Tax=Brachionus plicatilis TaxID=10195 RepID=A0A3M7QTR8_BRAPC|nr:hypothetical protein BpHYR1_035400 [Brachionus plicatilis]